MVGEGTRILEMELLVSSVSSRAGGVRVWGLRFGSRRGGNRAV